MTLIATSEANILARAAISHVGNGLLSGPRDKAASRSSSRDACTPASMSASIHCRPWNSAERPAELAALLA